MAKSRRSSDPGVFRRFCALLLCAALFLGCPLQASAEERKDYSINRLTVFLSMEDSGAIIGEWEKAENPTLYRLELFGRRSGTYVSVSEPFTVDASSYDFSDMIVNIGEGYYRFTVTPVKGGIYYKQTSSILAVDSAMFKTLKKHCQAVQQAKIVPGWKQSPDGRWVFYEQDKSQVKEQWKEIGGHSYYFDADGWMVTGWQAIGSRWYYLEPVGTEAQPMGSRWENTVTPGGFTVNGEGIWVRDGQEVEAEKNTVKESAKTDTSYTKVALTVPEGFYLTAAGLLRWDPVENAARYYVEYFLDSALKAKFYVDTPAVNLGERGIEPSSAVMLKIYACSEKVGTRYTRTRPYEIYDLQEFADEHTQHGFFNTIGDKTVYLDENGNKAKGWKTIAGYTYYFYDDGSAAGPGWLENGGFRYYFNDRHRMKTGKVTVDGKVYTLNDGSDPGYPLGALITE